VRLILELLDIDDDSLEERLRLMGFTAEEWKEAINE